jgi:hypothetical protein
VQTPSTSFIIARDNDVFLLDGEGETLESRVLRFEYGGVEAVVVLRRKVRIRRKGISEGGVRNG